MKKHLLLIVFALTFCLTLSAQQESQFTNFMHNFLQLNPAYAGLREVPSITLLHRSQWIGFEGAPVSQVLSFNSPFFNKRVGFGMTLFHRTAGISETWSGTLAYSYDLQFSEETSVKVGLQASVRYLGMDFSDPRLVIRDLNDEAAANGLDQNQYTGNFGAGFVLRHKELFFGASVPNLFPNEIGFNTTSQVIAKESPHFYAMGGGFVPVSDNIRLRPSFLLKYVDNAPVDLDVNLSVVFENEVAFGASYRMGGTGAGESIDIILYYQINPRIGLGLGYDFVISELARQQSGSFEALARYDFTSGREDLTNPRFF